MKAISVFSIVIFFVSSLFSQNLDLHKVDSLFSVLKSSPPDSIRMRALSNLSNLYKFSSPDSAILFGLEAASIAEKIHRPTGKAQAYIHLAAAYALKNDYFKSMQYSKLALHLADSLLGTPLDDSLLKKVLSAKSTSFKNLGIANDFLGNFPEALKWYLEDLKLKEKTGDKKGMAGTLNNIGGIYLSEENFPEALKYFNDALKINEEAGNLQWKAANLANIANIYYQTKDYEKGLEFSRAAQAIYKEIGDDYGLANTHLNIGSSFAELGKNADALREFNRALAVNKMAGNPDIDASANLNKGNIYLNQHKISEASSVLRQALAIAEETGGLENLMQSHGSLARLDSIRGNYRDAFEHYKKFVFYRDSMFNEQNTQKLVRTQMQYDFDKKEAETKAEQDKKDALAAQELQRQKLLRNGFIGGFAAVLLFAGVFFRQRNRIAKEKKRSDELLLNILPEEVAEELKAKGHADAKLINEVTVLFTDFVGFTKITESMSPRDLVDSIDKCFSAFDRIIEKNGLEKIKTIGDAYMAAGGLPTPNQTHASDVVSAALEIQQFVQQAARENKEKGELAFEIRLGVHTGPVVAGIVGIKKFAYDIWGDTVNIAARMESSGEVGKVNISQSTYLLVKDAFVCTHRGKIEAKNKGEIDMYFVEQPA